MSPLEAIAFGAAFGLAFGLGMWLGMRHAEAYLRWRARR